MLAIITKAFDTEGNEELNVPEIGNSWGFSDNLRAVLSAIPREVRSLVVASAANKLKELGKLTQEFRLLDDDGNVYFEGMVGGLDGADGDTAFKPLDWAQTYVGATTMQYRDFGATEWRTL